MPDDHSKFKIGNNFLSRIIVQFCLISSEPTLPQPKAEKNKDIFKK